MVLCSAFNCHHILNTLVGNIFSMTLKNKNKTSPPAPEFCARRPPGSPSPPCSNHTLCKPPHLSKWSFACFLLLIIVSCIIFLFFANNQSTNLQIASGARQARRRPHPQQRRAAPPSKDCNHFLIRSQTFKSHPERLAGDAGGA